MYAGFILYSHSGINLGHGVKHPKFVRLFQLHNNNDTAMDIAATVAGIQPLTGQVIPIRTVQETRPPEEFGMWLQQDRRLRF